MARQEDRWSRAYSIASVDATYRKARVNHRIVSQAVVVATGSPPTGHHEVVGFNVGTARTARSGPCSYGR